MGGWQYPREAIGNDLGGLPDRVMGSAAPWGWGGPSRCSSHPDIHHDYPDMSCPVASVAAARRRRGWTTLSEEKPLDSLPRLFSGGGPVAAAGVGLSPPLVSGGHRPARPRRTLFWPSPRPSLPWSLQPLACPCGTAVSSPRPVVGRGGSQRPPVVPAEPWGGAWWALGAVVPRRFLACLPVRRCPRREDGFRNKGGWWGEGKGRR